ncbi:Uncharacterised protein [Candidatus Bilamarchaeum dharawalense]|uniref:DUF7343 domain-containing protein n=1 Tax=Candidatus Bilamarchaeum dharawalense TaxID=2885759 RepID=A0A5E4LM80_9ARCH|nr:Uncharacterised protein [Candidatus Bilamarchaeum dharawalense]
MRIFALLILTLTLLHSTTISGEIYDADSMKVLNNTIVTVEGSGGHIILQQLSDSPYSIDVESGNYTVRAYHFQNGTLTYYSDYKVLVNQNNVQLDLVLLPYELLSLSPGFTPPPAVNHANLDGNSNNTKDSDPPYLLYFSILIILILILALAYWFFTKKKIEQPTEKFEPDHDCQVVLKILRENEGRMIQKELREILGFSETKMSLIITELEVSGCIKKIKKGRENILKLVK